MISASNAMTLVSPPCETPFWLVAALDRPYTKAATPSVPVNAPGRSKRPVRRGDSGSTRVARAATSRPPAISPAAGPASTRS
jgi:hypothetical protein